MVPFMSETSTTRAELVLGPADGQEAGVPLRPDGLPIRIHRQQVDGQVCLYLRRHRAVGRDWVYIHEPDAK
jgi:hypothetical protein